MNNQNWTGRFICNETSGQWNPRIPVTSEPDSNIKGWAVVILFGIIIAAMFAFTI